VRENVHRKPVVELLIYAILFIAGGAIFLTRSNFPTDWDACQFVLGMERFSPVDHQPHPPGYFFFIQLAHLLKWLLHLDSHTALLLTSALGSALLVPAIFGLTGRLYPARLDIRIGAALLVLAAPTRLFFGAQALCYTWEGLFATLLVLTSLALDPQSDHRKTGPWLLWMAIFAFAGGFRPNLLLFFLPLGIWLAISRRWWEVLIGLVIFGLITWTWVIPSTMASDGLTPYLNAMRGHSDYFLKFGLGTGRVVDNVTALFNTPAAITGLHLVGWIIVLAAVRFSRSNIDNLNFKFNRHQQTVFLITGLTLFIFHTFIFFTFRYSLLYAPVLIPFFASLPGLISDKLTIKISMPPLRIAWVLPALLLVFSYYSFLTSNSIHSLSLIRAQERQTKQVATFVRDLGEPDNTVLITTRQFRRWGIALSEYKTFYPMHAIYPPYLHPRLSAMQHLDTYMGDFFQPGAPESDTLELSIDPDDPVLYIVLDQHARNNLLEPLDGWNIERITSQENLYWQSFNTDVVLIDEFGGFSLLPVVPE